MFFLPLLLGGAAKAIGGISAANQQEAVADANYAINAANAERSYSADMMGIQLVAFRNRLSLSTAEQQFRFAMADARARARNAERLRQFAEARTSTSRENIRRQRAEFERFESKQIATMGASGVVANSGSPAEILTETAANMQLALVDMQNEENFERDRTLQEAGNEQFAFQMGKLSAKADRQSAIRGFKLNRTALKLERLGARDRYQAALSGASIDQAAGYSQASGTRMGTLGGVFSGLGNYALLRNERQQRNF